MIVVLRSEGRTMTLNNVTTISEDLDSHYGFLKFYDKYGKEMVPGQICALTGTEVEILPRPEYEGSKP